MYTNVSLPLTAIADFEVKGQSDPFFKELSVIVKKTNGLWSTEAEEFLIKFARPV
jgi:hypothetical protein